MDEILTLIRKERSQLESHREYGELHLYIDDNVNDILRMYDRIIKLAEGVEKHAA